MSDNYITLGPTPAEETCTMVGGDKKRAELENKLYKAQLELMFSPYKNIKFTVRSFPHDFGTYTEVCVVWLNEVGQQEALDVDENLPSHWNAESLEKLADYDSSKACND